MLVKLTKNVGNHVLVICMTWGMVKYVMEMEDVCLWKKIHALNTDVKENFVVRDV